MKDSIATGERKIYSFNFHSFEAFWIPRKQNSSSFRFLSHDSL